MKAKISGLTLPLLVAVFNALLILFPSQVLSAAREGVGLWFNNVLPALLPFIIGTNLLTGLGFINFLGTLLTPIMRPVFGVPGCGGFAIVAGMVSGYPIGAKIVGGLRERGELTQAEAQRLLSVANNSGPLFIAGVVGMGMFRNKNAGYLIMAAHYGGAIITGLLFRHYKRAEKNKDVIRTRILSQGLRAMRCARKEDGRPLGKLLGDSVKNAMEAVIQVGGFIILFCVIVRILEVTGFILPQPLLTLFFNLFHMDGETCKGFIVGLVEITNGAKILSEASFINRSVIIAAGLVSFGGLSIHAQSISFFSHTDIKISVYLFSKMVHGIISVILAVLLSPFFELKGAEEVAVSSIHGGMGFLTTLIMSSSAFLAVIFLIPVFCMIYYFYRVSRR